MPGWSVGPKHDLLRLRLDPSVRRKLERAAAYEETSIAQFILEQAMLAAECVIEVHERVPPSPALLTPHHNGEAHEIASGRKHRPSPRRPRSRVGP